MVQGNWLGRVEEVMDNVTVSFEDGARCKLYRAETDRLIPITTSLMDDTNCPYYPGQQVRAATAGVFQIAKWLKGKWKNSRREGTVIAVEAGSLLVSWIASGNAFSGASQQIPAVRITRLIESFLQRK